MISSFIKNNIKKISILFFTIVLIMIIIFVRYEKEYIGEYMEWGEIVSGSNVTKLLEDNHIPYKIKNGVIYIPEDAFDKAIYCCA